MADKSSPKSNQLDICICLHALRRTHCFRIPAKPLWRSSVTAARDLAQVDPLRQLSLDSYRVRMLDRRRIGPRRWRRRVNAMHRVPQNLI
jgi:hypothetical protein